MLHACSVLSSITHLKGHACFEERQCLGQLKLGLGEGLCVCAYLFCVCVLCMQCVCYVRSTTSFQRS